MIRKILILALSLSAVILQVSAGAMTLPVAQEQKEEAEDSLVRLLSGKSAQLLEIDGMSYRKIVGPAVFFHNNTYLHCDTALWNVDTRIIDAIGNVRIVQEQTELQSEKMQYFIDRDLAEFRGDIVQLRDRDGNTLRTKFLDYNTKDSVGIFFRGGSMRDKDGQIIESQRGTYDSKIRVFDFATDVNMFTDSIFIKTNTLKYESDYSLATFGTGTNAWKDDYMLSSEAGWYDRDGEQFFFRRNVHLMSATQEAWCDTLYFDRNTSDVRMYGHIQVTDTTRNVYALAGRMDYVDSVSTVTMTEDPAVVLVVEENARRDSVYCGADTLIYRSKLLCEVDSVLVAEASLRRQNMDIDPVMEFRRKAAEEAARKAAEEAENDPAKKAQMEAERMAREKAEREAAAKAAAEAEAAAAQEAALKAAADSLAAAGSPAVSDSLAVTDSLLSADSLALTDSLASVDSLAAADSVITPDSTKIGFVTALRNVKIFRENMQVVCDSLLYSDLDSIARLFREPAIWNEITQQYNADSVYVLMRNQAMEKASLMSNSFIHIQEDTAHYNQIKGAEMMAYFTPEGKLSRFDGLGGASAIFYIEENDTLATVNKKDAKMLSAIFREGQLHRIYYFDTAVSDAYPVVQLSREDRKLKGFNWTPERRPVDRHSVTSLDLRPSERKRYNAVPRASYTQTDLYFPGYIDDIYHQISLRDSLNHVRELERQEKERLDALREQQVKDSLAIVRLDSLNAAKADSIAFQDSLKAAADSVAVADSIARADSLAASDTQDRVLTKAELKAQKKAERERLRQERKAAREARWEAKDRADAEREQARADRKAEKQREKKRRVLRQTQERARKDAAMLEKYLERFERRQKK